MNPLRDRLVGGNHISNRLGLLRTLKDGSSSGAPVARGAAPAIHK